MNEWYVANGAQQIGPISSQLILKGIDAGKLSPQMKIAKVGENTWIPLGDSEEFRAAFAKEAHDEREDVTALIKLAPPTPSLPPPATSEGPGAGIISRVAVTVWALAVLVTVGACAWKLWLHKPAAHLTQVEQDLRTVLQDRESIERAVRCTELLADETEFHAGMPYVAEPIPQLPDRCKVVSKSKPEAKRHGSFVPSSYRECKGAGEEASRHENNLDAKIKLACGADRKPSFVPDASVRLATELAVHARLAGAVKAINAGNISTAIATCYQDTKSKLLSSAELVRKERCAVFNQVMNMNNVTYDAIFSATGLGEAFEQYKSENRGLYQELSKTDETALFFDMFLTRERKRSCDEAPSVTVFNQDAASTLALQTCL